jgi:rfaE bifunctional protein nucleotidyltransferase chain/domain
MHPRRGARTKLLDVPQLLAQLERERRQGRRIVFTNGCFDLLHAGHLQLLETAAGLGDVLIVALNRDASVRRLKGAERPFVPFEQRAALVAALEAVSWVVGFDEPTPLSLIELVRPDVLVKGGDWPAERIVGRESVASLGGRVVTVPPIAGLSTSALVRRIRAAGRPPARRGRLQARRRAAAADPRE